jgi:tRNA(Ile)-lysidine synthase
MSYCQEHRLDPRGDSSNLALSFFRNRLRLELLPLLRQYNPSVDQALLRLAEIAKDDGSFIEQQASELWDKVGRQEDEVICLDKKQIATLPIALQRQLIRLAIAKILGDTRDIEAIHIEAVRGLLSRQAGKRISLPHGLVSHGEYGEILIAGTATGSPENSQNLRGENQSQLASWSRPFPPLYAQVSLKVPGETWLPGWRVIASIAQERWGSGDFIAEFDLHKTGTELFVRQREPGDRFQPLGMNITKKLQDFMVDAKIPRSWREHIPIVCSPQQIIWIVGWRIDDRVKVTEATKEVLRLESIKSP